MAMKTTEERRTELMNKCMGFFNRIGTWFIYNQSFVDKAAQVCYLFGLLGVAGWGVFIAIPFLYSECEPWKEFAASFIAYLSFIHIVVSWLCIKFVKSSYNPSVHGTKPDDLAIGENICEARNKYNEQIDNGNGAPQTNSSDKKSVRKRKNATPVSTASVMYVATEMPTAEHPLHPKRTAFPYFSWTPCLRCNRPRPPRCHHCPLCNVCVLKRDHHCFFAGTCIGYRNQRYFSVFIFWTTVATVFTFFHGLIYMYYELVPATRWFDFIIPIGILRALIGYIYKRHALLIVLAWLLLAFLAMSISFILRAYSWLATSTTSFEKEYKFHVLDTRDIWDKLRGVFGRIWILNFLLPVPLHFIFDAEDDPIRWPTIRA